MKYTVVWTNEAVDKLIVSWMRSRQRAEITAAVDALDRLLGENPSGVGESRVKNERIVILAPVVLYYDLLEEDRKVRITAARIL